MLQLLEPVLALASLAVQHQALAELAQTALAQAPVPVQERQLLQVQGLEQLLRLLASAQIFSYGLSAHRLFSTLLPFVSPCWCRLRQPDRTCLYH